MSDDLIDKIIDIFLPFVTEVSLNSAGEPLLHPRLEDILSAINRHQCRLLVQTNGTMFTQRNIDLLCQSHGTISISIDGTGDLFERLRCNGRWAAVDSGVRALMARRDPSRLRVQIAPTLSASNVSAIADITAWAHETGIDYALFRHFRPFSIEGEQTANKPRETPVSREEAIEGLIPACRHLQSVNSPLKVVLEDEIAYPGSLRPLAPLTGPKSRMAVDFCHYPVLRSHPAANPHYLCCAPFLGLDIGVDGDMTVCCRSQGSPLTFVDSLETFADFWFGDDMERIRTSLMHGSHSRLPMPSCRDCVAAETGLRREMVEYTAGEADGPDGIRFGGSSAPLTTVIRDRGHGCIGLLPVGLRQRDFVLAEDGVILKHYPASEEETASLGGGRWSYRTNGAAVYFSSSDDSDPLTNGRQYRMIRIGAGCP